MIILLIILIFIILVLLPIRYTSIITRNVFRSEVSYTDPQILLGLDYKEIEFQTEDNLKIKGWLVRSDGNKATVILCHGIFASMDDRIDCIPFLHQAGYNVVTFDFRNHGRSEGKITTLGYYERLDLRAAVNFIVENKDLSDKIIVWGVSMGSATGLLEASENPHINGVISESSFLSFQQTLSRHGKLLYGIPPFPMVYLTMFWMRIRTGMKPYQVDLIKAVRKLENTYLLFVGSEEDDRILAEDARKLFDECQSKHKDIWITKIGQHAGIYYDNQAEYEKRVLQFIDEIKP